MSVLTGLAKAGTKVASKFKGLKRSAKRFSADRKRARRKSNYRRKSQLMKKKMRKMRPAAYSKWHGKKFKQKGLRGKVLSVTRRAGRFGRRAKNRVSRLRSFLAKKTMHARLLVKGT